MSRPWRLAAPEYVLEAGHGRCHAPAVGGGVGGPGVQDNWLHNGLLNCRGSSVVGSDLFGNGEGGESLFPSHSRGRSDVQVEQVGLGWR